MKKHISVFGLFARSSIFKVLGILLLMCAVEATVFYFELQGALEAFEATGSMISLERTFAMAATNVYFRLALVLVTVVLCLPGCRFKSEPGYTLCRLSVSESATFLHQAAYNALVYVMLIAAQLVAVFAMACYYVAVAPAELVSNQTVTLAFYRSDFLHSLLPMEDVALWIRNGLLVVSLGIAAAEFPYKQRRHKFSAAAMAMVTYTIVWFEQSIGRPGQTVVTLIIFLIVISEVAYSLAKKEEEEGA